MAEQIEHSEEEGSQDRQWSIDGPDADGIVWFRWDGAGPRHSFNLGSLDEVAERLTSLLAKWDYGE